MLQNIIFTVLVVPFLMVTLVSGSQYAVAQDAAAETQELKIKFKDSSDEKGAMVIEAVQADGSAIKYDGPLRMENAETVLWSVCPTCSPGHCCWHIIGGNWICHHDFCPTHP